MEDTLVITTRTEPQSAQYCTLVIHTAEPGSEEIIMIPCLSPMSVKRRFALQARQILGLFVVSLLVLTAVSLLVV